MLFSMDTRVLTQTKETKPRRWNKSHQLSWFKIDAWKSSEYPTSEFSKLEENDILFMDSSHALKIGSDVQYEILEILLRLTEGVIVHVHDIFLPAEDPKNWVLEDFRFLNEQYLLQAFLVFNKSFEV